MRRLFVPLVLLLTATMATAQMVDVRVLLERTEGGIVLQVDEAHTGYVGDQHLFATPLPMAWPIAAVDGLLEIDGTRFVGPLTLAPASARIAWRGTEYRGALRFQADGDELLVVNVLALDEYLRGVVPAEMMAAWPLEALKAQAVASRTYTLASLDRLAAYDVCATVECQRYAGVAAEHLRSDRAVAETMGLVLTYQGDFARTYYHADSGGALASSAEVWGTALPYLASRSDVVASTPHRSWRHSLDGSRLAHGLAALGHDIGTVVSLRVTSYSESGRVRQAELRGSRGAAVLSGGPLTTLLRAAGLKSTRFTMVGDLVAAGDGWGHGVGMSQYGARALAASGYAFDQILSFYYPETRLGRIASTAAERHP